MTKGLGRFEYYFIQLDTILQEAERSKNPAMYLYENDGRTKAFMLEGLARLYSEFHNKKKFTKIKDSYKALEDLLGKIDYYDNLNKDLLKNKTIPASIKKYLSNKMQLHVTELNSLLLQKKWIGHSPTRTQKQRKKLKNANWLKPDQELALLKKYYTNAVDKIVLFYNDNIPVFTDMELQVHELRRKLRWLSIYPHAMQGCIQLLNTISTDKNVKKYLTKEITNSPYNKFPSKGINKYILNLEQNYFYALSFVINALGAIKDKGLQIEAIAEALQATEKITKTLAVKKALQLTKQKDNYIGELLKNANEICKPFFEEKNLFKMLNF